MVRNKWSLDYYYSHDSASFKKLLGDGSQFGCKFEFAVAGYS